MAMSRGVPVAAGTCIGAPAALCTAFAALWETGTLFHIASYNQWGQSRWLVISAAIVLLFPRSVPALLTLSSVQVIYAWRESPFIPNHYLFAALVNATIVASALLLIVRQRRIRVDAAALVETFGPPVRVALILLYGFVVFHKLNADFFDPLTSCGTVFYAAQADRLSFLPRSEAMAWVSIALALLFEAIIPLLLARRKTRGLGIVVGAVFHWFLALTPTDRFYNFSSLLLALFTLFASPALVAHGLDRLGPRRWRQITTTVLAAIMGSFFAGKYLESARGTDLFLILWTVYGAIVIVALLVVLRVGRPKDLEPAAAFRVTQPLLVALPIAVLLNGLTPYLGLKTETAWAMFSNLRTEGGRTNHFLVPPSVQIFDYQRDLVRIVRSSDRYLSSLAAKQLEVPFFELQRRTRVSVTYERNGVEERLEPAGSHSSREQTPLILRKLMMFRAVDPDGRQHCRH